MLMLVYTPPYDPEANRIEWLWRALRRAVTHTHTRETLPVGRQNLTRAQISDADGVLELLWLLFTTVRAAARPHQDVVLENLLLRHQLAVLTRPTRSRPHAGFTPGTSCSGSWLAASVPAGASI